MRSPSHPLKGNAAQQRSLPTQITLQQSQRFSVCLEDERDGGRSLKQAKPSVKELLLFPRQISEASDRTGKSSVPLQRQLVTFAAPLRSSFRPLQGGLDHASLVDFCDSLYC